ncbi:hypothetical protein, partial [Cetobacterium sp.]|uniref:hypothetical protein n=1 Tax=Cetobacterium sp. TaxID=2071632 RepID=UPI003F3727B8
FTENSILYKTVWGHNEKVRLAKDQNRFSLTLILSAGRVRDMGFSLKTAFCVKLALCIMKKSV